jgi:hypothetical protein
VYGLVSPKVVSLGLEIVTQIGGILAAVDLYAEMCALVRGLDEAGVEYALCGGLALAVHGVTRATRDIGILAQQADLEIVRKVARGRGFTIEILLMPFSGGLSLQRFTKLEGPEPVGLDVLLINDELEPVWMSRTQVAFDDGSICVVSKTGLITLKRKAGRPQDLLDIQLLEELDNA